MANRARDLPGSRNEPAGLSAIMSPDVEMGVLPGVSNVSLQPERGGVGTFEGIPQASLSSPTPKHPEQPTGRFVEETPESKDNGGGVLRRRRPEAAPTEIDFRDVAETQAASANAASVTMYSSGASVLGGWLSAVFQLLNGSPYQTPESPMALFERCAMEKSSEMESNEKVATMLLLTDLASANKQVRDLESKGSVFKGITNLLLLSSAVISLLAASSKLGLSEDANQFLLFSISVCNILTAYIGRQKGAVRWPSLEAAARQRRYSLDTTARAFFSRQGAFKATTSQHRAGLLHDALQEANSMFSRAESDAKSGSTSNFNAQPEMR